MGESEESVRGALIVFEGLDRSGKSTTVAFVCSSLEGEEKIEKMPFPDRTTPTGKKIRELLEKLPENWNPSSERARKMHELFSLNRFEKKDEIMQKLQSGITLLVDRYSYSGIAYSLAQGVDLQHCLEYEAGLPEPDAVIHLNISAEETLKRGEYGSEVYESLTMQNGVTCAYRYLYDFLSERQDLFPVPMFNSGFERFAIKKDRIPTLFWVNASQSIEDVHVIARHIVKSVIKTCRSLPLPGPLFTSDPGRQPLGSYTHDKCGY